MCPERDVHVHHSPPKKSFFRRATEPAASRPLGPSPFFLPFNPLEREVLAARMLELICRVWISMGILTGVWSCHGISSMMMDVRYLELLWKCTRWILRNVALSYFPRTREV